MNQTVKFVTFEIIKLNLLYLLIVIPYTRGFKMKIFMSFPNGFGFISDTFSVHLLLN